MSSRRPATSRVLFFLSGGRIGRRVSEQRVRESSGFFCKSSAIRHAEIAAVTGPDGVRKCLPALGLSCYKSFFFFYSFFSNFISLHLYCIISVHMFYEAHPRRPYRLIRAGR